MAYDGDERRKEDRKSSLEMHDTLIRIDANLSNFMKRFDDHVKDDEKQFAEVKLEVKSAQGESKTNRWYIAIGAGIMICIEFFKEKIFK